MATLNQLKSPQARARNYRYFSTELKQKLVKDLDKQLLTKAEISREYQVSRKAIDKWVHKYSALSKKGIRMVVESKSDTRKILELKQRIKELEQLVGQKQISIEFLEKLIELANVEFGIDIKKKIEKMTLLWFWTNREKVTFSLNRLYSNVEISKQSMHDWLNRYFAREDEWEQIVWLIRELRVDHPGMGSRKLYYLIQPKTFGRDRFIERCNQNGFKLAIKKNAIKTTNSLGVTRFPNLIMHLKIVRGNKVWVSDITYYRIGERFYYLTFIMDFKSKFIVGFAVSKSLTTEDTTLVALKMALKLYPGVAGTILHSDGGGQYYCKEFVSLTKRNKMKNSMAQSNSENNHAERINSTIKNQYLSYYMPTGFEDLINKTGRAVYNYNYSRPHESLKMATPVDIYEFSTKNQDINKEKKKQKKKDYNNNYIYIPSKKTVKAI